MKKRKSESHGKDVYYLGKTSDGEETWLEAPSWDCEWYWGFGYVQTKDSHQHIDSSVLGKDNAKDGGYCHNPFDSKFFTETTFDKEEGWELGELFKSFYLLKDMAGYFHTGGAHIATAKLPDRKDLKEWKRINEELIPPITARIIEILTP